VLPHVCAAFVSSVLITVGEFVSRAYCMGSVKIVLILPTRSELIFVSYKKDSVSRVAQSV
jgi:hypothetical protein